MEMSRISPSLLSSGSKEKEMLILVVSPSLTSNTAISLSNLSRVDLKLSR